MGNNDIKDRIVERVRELNASGLGVPFSLLHNSIDDLFEAEWHIHRRTLVTDINPHVVLWMGLTQPAIDAFIELFANQSLQLKACDPMMYPKSLYRPKLPIVTLDQVHQTLDAPHWLPTLLY